MMASGFGFPRSGDRYQEPTPIAKRNEPTAGPVITIGPNGVSTRRPYTADEVQAIVRAGKEELAEQRMMAPAKKLVPVN